MKRIPLTSLGAFLCALLIFAFSFFFSKSGAAPALIISSPGANGITVTWPATGSFQLMTNDNLFKNWTAYGGSIQSNHGTNSATLQPLATPEFFCLMQTDAPAGTLSFISPTNVPGMAYYWNYRDLPLDSSINAWTDEVSGLVMTYNHGGTGNNVLPLTTNFFPGLDIPAFGGFIAFTNNLASLGSNFTVWIVMRPALDFSSPVEGIFGNGSVSGIDLSGNTLGANWGNGQQNSSMVLNYANTTQFPYGQTYDILDSGGTLYSNGVALTAGVSQPLDNFQFNAIGSGNVNNGYSAQGYLQYIGVWTNHLLTATDATNLDYWYWNYGVTNITNGLLAWWKLNEGSGTTAADSWSTNTLYFGGTDNLWTNGPVGNGGGVYFDGNGWLTNVDASFADNLPAMTVSFWVQETGLGGNNVTGSLVEKGINTGYYANNSPGWAIQGDGTSNVYFGTYQSDGTYTETPHDNVDPVFPIIGDNHWHFIVGVYTNVPGSGMTPYVYVDGAQITGGLTRTGGATDISAPNSVIFIGAENVGPTAVGSPAGAIDDVRIYNRVLSSSEIQDLYKWRGQP